MVTTRLFYCMESLNNLDPKVINLTSTLTMTLDVLNNYFAWSEPVLINTSKKFFQSAFGFLRLKTCSVCLVFYIGGGGLWDMN